MAKGKPKAKVGRPTKRTAAIDALILKALGVGCSLANAAKLAGIDADTLLLWRKKDDRFSVDCEKAAASAVHTLAGTLYAKAEGGDLTALIFWLKCRAPEFREPKEPPPSDEALEPDPRFE